MGQLPQGLHGFVGVGLELVDKVGRLLGSCLGGHGFGHGQVHLDGDQLLLGSIVEVAFQAAALVVLRADQARA
ncbi:MAG: hypothetical protein M3378_02635 [Actinomycetota bacterium]|nr:hypothetical protein [Actinomycetota bacterium]